MRIYDGKEYRDATPEEEAEYNEQFSGESEPTFEERFAELEVELAATKILLGVE